MIQDTNQSIAYIWQCMTDCVTLEVERGYLAKYVPYYYTALVMKQSQ